MWRLRYHAPLLMDKVKNRAYGTRVVFLIPVICFMFYPSNLFLPICVISHYVH
jgi:hypothetical protein